jgi:hypothetical protein
MATRKNSTTEPGLDDEGNIVIEVPPEPTAPVVPTTTEVNPATGRTFTEAEIEAARQQEKDKLYPRLEEMQQELTRLRAAEEERTRLAQTETERAAAAEAARQEAERKAAEAELSAKELLERRQAEWTAEMAQVREDMARRDAMFAQERRFAELQVYKANAVAAAQDDIAPEFLAYVGGETEAEIEASIEMAKTNTASILANVAGLQQQQRRESKGTSVTAPPVGPVETAQALQSFSPEQIAAMPMSEWAKFRGPLMAAASQQRQQK